MFLSELAMITNRLTDFMISTDFVTVANPVYRAQLYVTNGNHGLSLEWNKAEGTEPDPDV